MTTTGTISTSNETQLQLGINLAKTMLSRQKTENGIDDARTAAQMALAELTDPHLTPSPVQEAAIYHLKGLISL